MIVAKYSTIPLAIALLALAPPTLAQVPPLPAATQEQRTVLDATTVFQQMLEARGMAIPKAMLSGAEGVAIIPGVVKGGFIVGARYGRGVVITRDAQGVWHAPVFLTLTGGNIGWQAGVQSTDVVLIYRTQRSVDSLMRGKLTIGADVAAAAGPVGRQAAAATDSSFKAEVYSYSRSRGLFAGVSLDGSVLKIDHVATAAYYRPKPGIGPDRPSVVPPEAQQLVSLVIGQTAPDTLVAPPQPTATAETAFTPTFGPQHTLDEAVTVRDQLAEFAPRLFRLLDESWQAHLSLPVEVFQETGHPTPEKLAVSLRAYDEITENPQYADLAARPVFQTVHGLLRHYMQLLTDARKPLALPPPPSR